MPVGTKAINPPARRYDWDLDNNIQIYKWYVKCDRHTHNLHPKVCYILQIMTSGSVNQAGRCVGVLLY